MCEAIENDDVPLEQLARELKPDSDASHNPFFASAISLQPPMPNLDLPWSVTTMDIESGGSPWELYLAFIDQPEGLAGRVQFNTDVFDEGAITRLLQDFETLLGRVSENPRQRLSEMNSVAHS